MQVFGIIYEKEEVHSNIANAVGTIHNKGYFKSLLTQSKNTPSLSPRSTHGWSSPMIDHDLQDVGPSCPSIMPSWYDSLRNDEERSPMMTSPMMRSSIITNSMITYPIINESSYIGQTDEINTGMNGQSL